jgi:predicted ABC-type ATPase
MAESWADGWSQWARRFNTHHLGPGKGGGEFTSAGGAGKGLADEAADSLTAHTRGGKLTPEREALHEQIISGALRGTERSEHPTATFMGGGPASGKSAMLKLRPATGVVIDPDEIKAQLPEYQKMVAEGNKAAASYVHEESSQIAKKLMARAIEGRRNYTLDGTGDSDFAKLSGKVEQARDAGYRTHGQYVTVDTHTAVDRAAKRAEHTGRMVPETFIRETHASVSSAFRKAMEHHTFDTAELWDNNRERADGGIRLIGSKAEGRAFKPSDMAAWKRFLAKEHEH